MFSVLLRRTLRHASATLHRIPGRRFMRPGFGTPIATPKSAGNSLRKPLHAAGGIAKT